MTIFEIINQLLFNRKASCEELDHESLNNFQPFLINRWMSFYNKAQAAFVNETLNRYTMIFQDKADTYKLYFNLTPRQRYSRIQYIKKVKNTTTDSDSQLSRVSNNLNISQREVELYIDFQKQLTK